MGRRIKPAKVKAEAKRPLARKSPKNEGSKVRDLEKRLAESLEREKATGELLHEKSRALTEALEQQTATSEILRVIGSSPTDVQPVFDTIVSSAVRLCDGLFSGLFRFDGERLHPVALHNFSPEALEILRRTFPMRPSRSLPVGRAILDCAVAHVPDVERDPEYRHLDFVARGGAVVQRAHLAHAVGWRSALAVPLLREGSPIGAIFVARAEAGSFSDGQISLLQTFADQAIIAIENVRLFTELQQKNQALTQAHAQVTESLEQQTATGEILKVVSASPTDVQPVFDTIAVSARHLCDALYSVVFRFEEGMITLVADDGASPEWIAAIRSAYPAPPGRSSVAAQAILERRVIAIADAQGGVEYPHVAEHAKAIGYRSIISVPMLRGDTVFGAINYRGPSV
jgi:two-component system, NtrC family, sensor kinase